MSAIVSAAAPAAAPGDAPAAPLRKPGQLTLTNAANLSISDDKPIMLDYWESSIRRQALIGVRENKEKLLVKDADQYTSPISKIYKVGDDFILVTENSIYIVDAGIPTKKISS
jgi:hypothetical protein